MWILSSHGGLGVERLLHKKCHSAAVDRIPLGETIPAMCMFYVYNRLHPAPVDQIPLGDVYMIKIILAIMELLKVTIPAVLTQEAIPEEGK